MTPTEATMLTRYIRAHFPQQPLDEFTADAVAELLADYSMADCRQAVLDLAAGGAHWCSPSDVCGEVKRIRGLRIAAVGDLAPPPGLTEPQERAWLGAARKRIADGHPPPAVPELPERVMPDLSALLPRPEPVPRVAKPHDPEHARRKAEAVAELAARRPIPVAEPLEDETEQEAS